MIILSVDAMGGDHGLDSTIPACIGVVKKHQDVNVVLVGIEQEILTSVSHFGGQTLLDQNRLIIKHAAEVIAMDESPAHALRKKKDSSMRVAINMVREGESNACISAGNTGALMATAKFVLKTIPGIERPAICSTLPKLHGHTYMLDLGANIDSPSEILFQFGIMGNVLIKCLEDIASPTIGLLNIGEEELKGNDTLKAAADLFRKSDLNYQGFVEADKIFLGNTDLVVCDGFIGNIALKASEGVVQLITAALKEEFSKNILTKSSALVASPALNALKARLDHRRYNGASLLGLRGTVVKSHGGTDAMGFGYAVEVAIEEVRKNLIEQLENSLT